MVIMACSSSEVTFTSVDKSRIPDKLTEGVFHLMYLRKRGMVEKLGERVRIRRQGGFCGLDVFLLLLMFYSAGATRGVRKFWEVFGPHVKRVAAVADRKSLPSPSALSRALSAVEFDLVRPVANWLLATFAGIDDLLRHPATKSYDALGKGWQAYDLDPTTSTLNQRALPEAEELPEPMRRAAETGAPGHSGRKRGDIQFRRVTVQHSGSAAWIHAHLSPGNGDVVADFALALDSIVETSERLGDPLDQVLVRMDGEYGNVPRYTACRERGLPFITRLNRPKLYEDPAILARLRLARWHLVPDSGAGPQRSAAELGTLTIKPGRCTKRPDGSPYEPVTVRIVASIFPKTGKAKRGRVIDGWQVELFAVDLPIDAWPAPDAIAAYFGRTAEENRFAQDDRELGLDRIVSYHLPGQELATLAGLSLWNIRLARGFALDTPPAEPPVQQLRQPMVDDRVPEQWPRDPVLRDILVKELGWTVMLGKRLGWTWDADAGQLLCEDGRPLTLTTVRAKEHADGRTGIIFRRPSGGCEDCDPRDGCLRTSREQASKHTEFVVPTPIADSLRDRLHLVRCGDPAGAQLIEPAATSPGPRVAIESLFLPAKARQVFQRVFLGATIHIEVKLPSPEPPGPRLVAPDVAARQRRRKTWGQNLERYRLPAGSKVHINVAAGATLRAMLGDTDPRRTEVGGAG